jgi:hypothetical protein
VSASCLSHQYKFLADGPDAFPDRATPATHRAGANGNRSTRVGQAPDNVSQTFEPTQTLGLCPAACPKPGNSRSRAVHSSCAMGPALESRSAGRPLRCGPGSEGRARRTQLNNLGCPRPVRKAQRTIGSNACSSDRLRSAAAPSEHPTRSARALTACWSLDISGFLRKRAKQRVGDGKWLDSG